MGTRGSVLFTDAYDQWVYVDTRYDGHTSQAAFEIATLPFARLARAEADLASYLAKGDPLWLDHKFNLTLETFARAGGARTLRDSGGQPAFLPFGPIANPFSADGTPNRSDIGSYLARSAAEGIIETMDHMERFLAFGEYDATSMARDFCSRQDRWIVSASGTGEIPTDFQQADIHVKTLDESRSGNLSITFSHYLDEEQTVEQSLEDLSRALNGPLTPFHAYSVRENKPKIPDQDEINVSIHCSMSWVYACLLARVMLAHPEFAQGLRSVPFQMDAKSQHDIWVSEGLIEPRIELNHSTHLFVMGLPVSPARAEAQPNAKPRWLFTRNPRNESDTSFGSHSPHGFWRLPPDSSNLSTTVALNTALCLLSIEELAPIGIDQIRALSPMVGANLLGSALDQAKTLGMVANLSPATAGSLAQIERELIHNHTPKAKMTTPARKAL